MRMIARCFELIIFDCDGVLVDSESIINQGGRNVHHWLQSVRSTGCFGGLKTSEPALSMFGRAPG
jgi:phosphoglycolate phosphatase-like HAD superfamily hydrolase